MGLTLLQIDAINKKQEHLSIAGDGPRVFALQK